MLPMSSVLKLPKKDWAAHQRTTWRQSVVVAAANRLRSFEEIPSTQGIQSDLETE